MGLEKAIQKGKEHRKPYKGAKAVSRSCRNHGACEWCKGNRLHNAKRKMSKEVKDEIRYINKYDERIWLQEKWQERNY